MTTTLNLTAEEARTFHATGRLAVVRLLKKQPTVTTPKDGYWYDTSADLWCDSRQQARDCAPHPIGSVLRVREPWTKYEAEDDNEGRRYSAVTMPRYLTRYQARPESVRFCRVQGITEEEAKAAGAMVPEIIYPDAPLEAYSYVSNFSLMWDALHGKGAWAANWWVSIEEMSKV